MNIDVNYLAVLLAAVASMIVGFLWYSQMLFGKPWMKLMGYNETDLKAQQKKMGMYYGLSFVLSLIMAYVLFHVMTMAMNFYRYTPIQTGLTSAFWIWFGFIMPVQATGEIFGGKKWNLFAINTGYQLVALLVMGIVLGYMG